METNSYARLEGRNFEFHMTKKKVVIGRNSKIGGVDVNMGSSRFISRRHLEITIDRNSFYLLCRGKNGVFVDGTFQPRENKRLQLPSSCIMRFPSTKIKLAFTSLLEDLVGPIQPIHSPAFHKLDNQFASPFVSPVPSPTGTISAVNSCPVSPSSEFRHRVPSFDLNIMAKYASKLLQHNPPTQMDTVESTEVNNRVDMVTATEASLPNPSKTPPISSAVTEIRDEEEEEEDEEVENNGEVPNNIVATKPGESSISDEDSSKMTTEKTQQKPPYSYAQLIVQALLASKYRRQTLSSIYIFISEKYPYYKLEDKGWKNSIRHNLSLNQYFMKAPREKEGLGFGKGGYWCMHPDYEEKLTAQAYVKRKKKGIPVFPSAHLISRSAPPSPTHHHPGAHNDITVKEISMEPTKFTLPVVPPSTSHFTLPTFFSQIPGGLSSSHSLPASPSRPPHGFTATPLKFFPVATPAAAALQGRAMDDLELIKSSHQRKIETIQEVQEEMGGDSKEGLHPPPEKRVRLITADGSHKQQQQQSAPEAGISATAAVAAGMVPLQAISAAGSGLAPPRVQFATQQPTGPLQFLPISLNMAQAPPPSHHQNLLRAPLSSFLPQSYFSRPPATMAAPPPPGPPPPPAAAAGLAEGAPPDNEE